MVTGKHPGDNRIIPSYPSDHDSEDEAYRLQPRRAKWGRSQEILSVRTPKSAVSWERRVPTFIFLVSLVLESSLQYS